MQDAMMPRTTTFPSDSTSNRTLRQRLSPTLFACMATLLSLPAQAATDDVPIPSVPLQSGTAYPAPNIVFILDDSGSMEWDFMPGAFAGDASDLDRKTDYNTGDSDEGMRVGLQTAAVNRLYYDPEIDYNPWMKADGTRQTGGTSIHEVFTDDNLLRGDGGSSDPHDDLADSDDVETFYVPKPDETADDARNFYRYQIRRVGNDGITGPRVVRSEYGSSSSVEHEDLLVTGISGGRDSYSAVYSIEVPEGASELIFTISVEDSDDEGADLYVRYENDYIRTNRYDWRENDRDSFDDISIDNPDAGTYYVVVRGIDSWYTGFDDLTLRGAYYMPNASALANAGCPGEADDDGSWINCTIATPDIGADGSDDDRTEAEEIENFATWYSYHRTRIKTAKAGASEAFGQLGDNYRVGYDSIWNRTRGVDSNAPDLSEGPAHPIPTTVSDGLFTGNNRAIWFDFLQSAIGNNGTPLQAALQRTGEYFESDAPWDSGDGADISCRQSFAILTTDGYWNSRDSSGYDYIGDIDSESGDPIYPVPTIKDGVEVPGTPYTYQPANPYQDADPSDPEADTLADVAMHYWNRDLRPTLDNNVTESTDDEAFWQHMVTFGVSIGLQGRLDPTADLNDITIGSKNWPNPNNNEDQDRIDDLWHASVNGHGKFVAATDPQQFVNGLLDALSTVAERPGSASNVAANSTSFRSDTQVYQASYVSGSWIGELEAFDASTEGVSATPSWQASQQMPAAADRAIWTWNGTTGADFVETVKDNSILARTSATDLAPVSSADNAAYIAGDQSLEKLNDGNLRNRSTVLGDIANSSPTYVRETETIFVGANDGMLHAFNALTGEERFAYVPGGINLTDLATLSDPHYTHKYFVDGPITVSATSQTPGHNYLVGALGRGGRGVFGLDVSDVDTSAFTASDVLWESTSDSDMGMVLGEPLVVTLNDAVGTTAVIVSNGINSPDGSAALFVLNIATGAIIAEIEAGTAGGNGLSAPRGWDDDGNGTVDFLYAGDIKGHLWKFDFTGSTSDSWVVANSGNPMFTATDSAGNAQPITTGLALAQHPDTGERWVFVGTGSFMTTADLSSTGTQTVYGLIDDGTVVTGRTSTTEFGDLVNREIVATGVSATGQPIRSFQPAVETLESGHKGWLIDLDTPATTYAERVVSGPRIFGEALIFSSIIPPTQNTCDAGGSGFVNALDAFTGASLDPPFFDTDGDGDFDGDDGLTVTTADGETVTVPAGSVDLGVGMPTRPTIIDKLLVVGGSTGAMGSIKVNPQGVGAKRISWREIRGD